MAKTEDLKRQKELTAEYKKLKEIMRAHNKTAKSYQQTEEKIKKIIEERREVNKKIADENKRVKKQTESLGEQMQRNLSTQVDLNNAGKTAVIGAKDLTEQQKTISKLINTDLDQRTDLSSIMIAQVKTANDLNDAQLKVGTTLFDNAAIDKEIADQLEGIEQKRLDIMTGRIALSEDEKTQALALLDTQEKNLKIQQDISKFQGMQDAAQKNLGKGMSDIKDQAMEFGAQLKAIVMNPMVALGAGLLAVGGYLVSMIKGAQQLKTELGISDEAAAGLQMQISEVSMAMKMAGVESADVAEAQMALINNFGGVSASSTDLLMNMAQLKADFGVSGQAAGALMVTLKSIGASSEKAAMEMSKNVASLAQAEGVAPGQVMQDIANNTEAFAGFAKDGGMNVAMAAIEAKKLGINFDTAVKIADNLLDFESSIQQQMEAEILLGRQLNLDKARQLALSGDIEGLQREVLKNVGSEADFNAMNVLQRRALAQSIGISVTELSKMVANQSNLNKLTKSQTNTANLMGFMMKIIRDLGQDFLEAWKVLSPILMVALIPLGLIVGTVVLLLKGISQVVAAMNSFGNAGTIILGTLLSIYAIQKLMGKETIANLIKEKILRTDIGKTIANYAGKAGKAVKDRASGMFSGLKDKMPELPKKPDSPGKDSNPLGFVEKINPKKILAGAAAMLIVSAALFVTAKALQEFTSVEFSDLVKAGVALLGLTLVLVAIGALMTSGVGAVAILAGAAAMLVIAAALLVLGHAIQAIGTGFSMLSEGLTSFTPLLTTLVPLASGIFILAGAFGALGMGMGALAIGALALLPALPVLLALAGIGMLGMALAGGGESDVAESEPMAVTDMSVTEEKLDGVISAVHALEATNRELLTTMNRGIKGLAEV